jgi:hypothetical protein
VECFRVARTGSGSHFYKGGPVTIRCAICGRSKDVKPSEAAKHTTCGRRRCRRKRARAALRNRIVSACAECGKRIEIYPCHAGKRKFCSRTCADVGQSKYLRGSRNGRYVHGQRDTPYPPRFTYGFKKAIRRRDGHVCQLCGMTRAEHGKALCVHHINHQKDDLRLINLIAVCRFCHGRMHGRPASRKYWQRKLSKLQRSRPAELFLKIIWKPSTTSKSKATTTTSPAAS